ncbi:hypothetical protein S40285_09998 [Stachybotrys chlorohalonatus IBT 40285]|uniref:Uncharacterized protein n=1 Tax=Stachybotrys chlorohalonatus (strain IBT 40285) TaxID=1283841 RepID=A0A084R0V9_STAC4|nr:hypothetical protein S40285_09998 [Stachybotrys chlorohalonata IBT 40285]
MWSSVLLCLCPAPDGVSAEESHCARHTKFRLRRHPPVSSDMLGWHLQSAASENPGRQPVYQAMELVQARGSYSMSTIDPGFVDRNEEMCAYHNLRRESPPPPPPPKTRLLTVLMRCGPAGWKVGPRLVAEVLLVWMGGGFQGMEGDCKGGMRGSGAGQVELRCHDPHARAKFSPDRLDSNVPSRRWTGLAPAVPTRDASDDKPCAHV